MKVSMTTEDLSMEGIADGLTRDGVHAHEMDRLDEQLKSLWSPSLHVALQFASALCAPFGDAALARSEVADRCATFLWQLLVRRAPNMPMTFAARYRALVAAVWALLRAVRETPAEPFVEEFLAVALRPVRRLGIGTLTPEICTTLYDYHRGVWAPHLTRPQLHVIENALSLTIASLPPEALLAFWNNLQSSDPMMHGAMLLGLKSLRSAHAVAHLLHGLEHSSDHGTRSVIVDCLEQIGEPAAIAPLARLRRETANTDWTLSRQIARAIRAIEGQNRNQQHRTLLRPVYASLDSDDSLLRPVGTALNEDPSVLLRSVRPHDAPGSAPASLDNADGS